MHQSVSPHKFWFPSAPLMHCSFLQLEGPLPFLTPHSYELPTFPPLYDMPDCPPPSYNSFYPLPLQSATDSDGPPFLGLASDSGASHLSQCQLTILTLRVRFPAWSPSCQIFMEDHATIMSFNQLIYLIDLIDICKFFLL